MFYSRVYMANENDLYQYKCIQHAMDFRIVPSDQVCYGKLSRCD